MMLCSRVAKTGFIADGFSIVGVVFRIVPDSVKCGLAYSGCGAGNLMLLGSKPEEVDEVLYLSDLFRAETFDPVGNFSGILMHSSIPYQSYQP